MYHTINEPISVAGVYAHSKFIPKKFNWKKRVLSVDKITLTSDVKDGGVRKRYYSLVSGVNVYRIEFNRDNEKWLLKEIWVD